MYTHLFKHAHTNAHSTHTNAHTHSLVSSGTCALRGWDSGVWGALIGQCKFLNLAEQKDVTQLLIIKSLFIPKPSEKVRARNKYLYSDCSAEQAGKQWAAAWVLRAQASMMRGTCRVLGAAPGFSCLHGTSEQDSHLGDGVHARGERCVAGDATSWVILARCGCGRATEELEPWISKDASLLHLHTSSSISPK